MRRLNLLQSYLEQLQRQANGDSLNQILISLRDDKQYYSHNTRSLSAVKTHYHRRKTGTGEHNRHNARMAWLCGAIELSVSCDTSAEIVYVPPPSSFSAKPFQFQQRRTDHDLLIRIADFSAYRWFEGRDLSVKRKRRQSPLRQ